MRVLAAREFSTWFHGLKEEGYTLQLELAGALLKELSSLAGKPGEETATFKRVRQATRHEIWRVAHPFVEGCAVRVLCWFPDDETAVVALVGADKVNIGDLWYSSAAVRAEYAVDDWQRQTTTKREQTGRDDK